MIQIYMWRVNSNLIELYKYRCMEIAQYLNYLGDSYNYIIFILLYDNDNYIK